MKIFKILGCPCEAVSSSKDAAETLTQLVESGVGGYSVAINAEKISKYKSDEELRNVIDGASFTYPDGAGAVLGLSWLHGQKAQKINFPVVALETANKNKWRVFLLGAREDVNAYAAEKISMDFPDINIVGRANGFHKEDDLKRMVIDREPQLIMLALGSPKQEFWADRIKNSGVEAFCVGCGGAFDIMAGRLKRAPEFMINNNLEWLYRIAQEPSRWRRQLVLPVFLGKLLREVVRRKVGHSS